MTALPQGWTSVRFEEVVDPVAPIIYGILQPGPEFPEGVKYVRPTEIQDGVIDLSSVRSTSPEIAAKYERSKLAAGDVLLSIVGTIGKVALVPQELEGANITQSSCRLRPDRNLTDELFLQRFLKAAQAIEQYDRKRMGTAVPRLNLADVRQFEIPLPPLPEQRRIVCKLDTLSARSTTARTYLTAIENLAERYKAGVLGLELGGTLIGHEPDPNNAQPITNGNERGAWAFHALPNNWAWVSFKAFLENRTDSYRKLPQKDYEAQGPYPVIDQGAQLIGGFSSNADLLLPADPPYIIFGDHTRCVKFFAAPFVQGADGVKVFHAGEGVDIEFAYWALKGLQLPDKGYSRHAKFLKESFFPRPPFQEQREIVRRIVTAFAKIDRLAAEATKALKLLDQLDSRILAKAFAGDLVPQDPNDEPAEILLARIRAERQTAPNAKRGRKKTDA